jgi:simple sugar transport system substrate-binding protein
MRGRSRCRVRFIGFAPLDRRDEVFQDILTKNPGLKLAATWGKVSDSTAADVQGQTAAALTANPDITAIFAPFDEFAKGAVLAIEAAGLQDKVKVYGADISTADIGVMTAKDSPWTATAAADPANVGRVAVRAVALQVAGEQVDAQISVEPALITRDFLVQHAITTMEQLRDQLPELTTPNLVNAPWFAALGG